MPWQETDPMSERTPFIAASLRHVDSMTELCERFGIRRHTGDKGVRRDPEHGPAGLQEQSRAPHRSPHRRSEEGEAVLWETKRAHLPWGPRTILPDLALPGPSTAGALCQRAGLRQARTRRRGHRHPGAIPLPAETPNAVWTADFKGQCRTGDGLYCDPLTVAAAYSRVRFGCSARLSTKPGEARPSFERLFQDDGLPGAIRPDNGPPFATPAFCGLSQLSGWWSTRGSRHQRSAPGRPEPNGAPERLHRPLNADATRPPAYNQAAPHARFDRFRREDHDERPHEALHYSPPALRYRPSPRSLPAQLPAPTYPGHYVVRRVSHAGTFRFQTRQLFISETLLPENSAFEETADGIWSIDFSDVLLARLDARDFKLYV